VKATYLIAQQEQELQLVPAQVPQQVQEQVLVQEQALESVSQLAQEQVSVLHLAQEQVSVPAQELQLVLAQARHPHHQPLQSRFQQQRSRLLQHEFLSAFLQLVKALQYQLCL
jgi:hypothetical protein